MIQRYVLRSFWLRRPYGTLWTIGLPWDEAVAVSVIGWGVRVCTINRRGWGR
jgi:hypothetical protein